MMLFARYLVQSLLHLATDLPQRGLALFRARRPALQVGRALALALTNLFAVMSLQHIPVGQFTAIVMLTPMAMTLVAALFWRERVPGMGWVLMASGFAGVLLVVRPGQGAALGWTLLLPLGTLTAGTVFQLLTARAAAADAPGTTNLWTAGIGTVLSGLAVLHGGWQPLSPGAWALLAGVALFNASGQVCLLQAYRHARAATVAPLLYTQLVFAALAGWWWLGQAPAALAWLGMALIAFSGIASGHLSRRA
jgi:drug/metabolite transporter (DMT)-like permease